MKKQAGVTIYDVARAAGVSITTVSRCLNSPEKVNVATLSEVRSVMDALGYVPQGNTGTWGERRSGQVAIIVPSFFPTPSFTNRLQGIAEVLRRNSVEMIVYIMDTLQKLDDYLYSLTYNQRIDGIILMSMRISDALIERFSKGKLPLITIEYSCPSFPCVKADDVQGGQLAGQYFAEKGFSPCAYLGEQTVNPYSLQPSEDRLRGYTAALTEAGIGLEDKYIRLGEYTFEQAYLLSGDLFDQNPRPRALFCMSDFLAFGALKAARERNLRVPEDVAILGFDDIDSASYSDLSTISQSLFESGKIAAEMLMSRMMFPEMPVSSVSLDVKLVLRKTT